MQSFVISTPKEMNEGAVLAVGHVKKFPNANKFTVTPPDGDGLTFDIEPMPNGTQAKVTVTNNPHRLSDDYIRGRLDSDLQHFASQKH